jgi:hypothetical protein
MSDVERMRVVWEGQAVSVADAGMLLILEKSSSQTHCLKKWASYFQIHIQSS